MESGEDFMARVRRSAEQAGRDDHNETAITTRFPQADLSPHIAAADEAVKALMQQRANPDAELAELEESVRYLYLNDPVFHYKVQLCVRAIEHRHPDIPYLEALRTALLILAIGRR